MKFFEYYDVLRSLVAGIFFGLLAGGIYKSLSLLISYITKLLLLEAYVLRSTSLKDRKTFISINTGALSRIKQNAYDFVFFTICGFLYVVLCYLTLDGVFRLYMLLITVLAFFFSKNTLGSIFEKALTFVFKICFSFAYLLLYVISAPLKVLISLFVKLLTPVFKLLNVARLKRKEKHILTRKSKEIKAFTSSVRTF